MSAGWIKSVMESVAPLNTVAVLSAPSPALQYPPPPMPPPVFANRNAAHLFPTVPSGWVPAVNAYPSKPTVAPAIAQQKDTSSGSWPPSLNAFVIRAFSTCSNELDRKEMTQNLEKLISLATSAGNLSTHAWDREKIPEISKATTSDGSNKRKNSRFEPVQMNSASRLNCAPPLVDVHQIKKTRRDITNDSNLNGKSQKGRDIAARHQTQHTEFDLESLRISGTCESLEKDYFRLTSAPDPSTVRPERVLKQALQALKRKWRENMVDYVYMCSQLKAIRQDITVQHLQSDFSVDVYETHARIALESDDMNEYNQCQTQLIHLYKAGLRGSEPEFIAYRILYYVYLLSNSKYRKGSSDLSFLLASICSRNDVLRDPAVQHALSVREAVQQGNYHKFFSLSLIAPNMGNFILNPMIDSARFQALQIICKGYKPAVPVKMVTRELGFDDIMEAGHYLRSVGCVFENEHDFPNTSIDTQKTVLEVSAQTQNNLLL